MRRAIVAALCLAVLAAPASAFGFGFGKSKPAYDWTALGTEFCARTLTGDLQGLRPLLSADLVRNIEFAESNAALPDPHVLFQTYTTQVPVCRVRTVNAALVEIERSNADGAAPAWKEYLVIVPERDGASRIDDVLFATRRSDTLRARLRIWAGTD